MYKILLTFAIKASLVITFTLSSLADCHFYQNVPQNTLNFQPVENGARKIVSKSIFTVPFFSRCPKGYRIDEYGECYRVLYVHEQEWLDQVMLNLNAFFKVNIESTTVTQSSRNEYVVINNLNGNLKTDSRYEVVQEPMRVEIPTDEVTRRQKVPDKQT